MTRPPEDRVAEAEELALKALTFLVADSARLSRFFALTGFTPDDLRGWTETPELQGAILEHLMGDESLLLVFCTETGIRPEAIAPAHAALVGAAGSAA